MFTRESIVEQLKNGIHTVTFTKVDGTERTMPCTLDETIIPVVEAKSDRKFSETALRVFVTDINEWRSFRIANVTALA